MWESLKAVSEGFQTQLAAQVEDREFRTVLDDFIDSGSQLAAQMLVDRLPFFWKGSLPVLPRSLQWVWTTCVDGNS